MAITKNPKKVNLMHHNTIRHAIDESVTEIVTDKGYRGDFRVSNVRLLIGIGIIVGALFAHFYNRKFRRIEKNVVLFTYLPPTHTTKSQPVHTDSLPEEIKLAALELPAFGTSHAGSFNSTRLVITSKLPRFSDLYTLTIASADPRSVSSRPPVELTRSVTKWFTMDGVLVEGILWKDIERLMDEYAKKNR